MDPCTHDRVQRTTPEAYPIPGPMGEANNVEGGICQDCGDSVSRVLHPRPEQKWLFTPTTNEDGYTNWTTDP